MHRYGKFQKPEVALALELRVCDLADARGCLAMTKTQRDAKLYEQALSAARRTCALDSELCAEALEVMVLHRPEEVEALARSICEVGDGKSCADVAIAQLNEPTKLSIRERACRLEDWRACALAAQSLQEKNPERAKSLYKIACRNGVDSACAIVGELQVSARSQTDKQIDRWESECARSIWKSCEKAGRELLSVNNKRGLELLNIACQHGVEPACTALNEKPDTAGRARQE